jgi:hypothetical protein
MPKRAELRSRPSPLAPSLLGRLRWAPPLLSLLLAPLLLLSACGGGGEDDFDGPQVVPTPDGRYEIRGNDWISLSESFHDFGKIWHGDQPSHTFRLKNRSKQTIRLVGLRSACSCAYVDLRIKDADGELVAREIHQPAIRRDGAPLITTLEPGEVLEAEVVVATLTLRSQDHKEPGETIMVWQPREVGTVRFGYQMHIVPRVRMDPGAELKFGAVSKYQRKPMLLELSPGDGLPPFEITKIEGADEDVRLRKVAATAPGAHRYMVEIGPFDAPQALSRVLSFHTDIATAEPNKPYVAQVVAVAGITPVLQFTPAGRLDFGRIDLSKEAKSFVTVNYMRPGYDPKLRLDGLEVKTPEGKALDEFFEAKLVRDLDDTWTVLLTYRGGLQDEGITRFQGRVLLRSDDEDHKATWLPITGFARRP